MSETHWPFRYELMDGLRGLAALAVVLFHLGLMEGGHYAVMLFFVISGYCIAAATETCRRNGASFGSFMRRRLHRIYPPYFFAIVFFVLTRIGKAMIGAENELHRPLLDWVQNLTMTQWLSLLVEPRAEAVQNPTLLVTAFWSLNYEEQFYLVMALALILATRGVPIRTSVIAVAVVGLAWNLVWPGGWVTGLFIEYWVDFALGVMLFHVLCVEASRTLRRLFVGAVTMLVILCAGHILPWEPDTLQRERAFLDLGVTSAFTLLLYFMRPISATISRLRIWKPVAALGVISYSLYLVHQFNLTVVRTLAERLAPGAALPVRGALMVVAMIGIAAVFWYLCERPFLNRPKGKPAASEGTRTSRRRRIFQGA